jgi:hypothetical protein
MPFQDTRSTGPVATLEDGGWEATRAQAAPATQILAEAQDDAADGLKDIGRQVGNDEYELFVSCGPAQALLQQFDVLRPEFIALHDVGCAVSRRLLAGVAQAGQRPLQKLTIRRQGYGNALARLEFVEWSSPGLRPIRLYSTEVDADTTARHAIALALLAHSRLGMVIVGDLPSHAIATALEPLSAAMREQAWPNRELLMLPLTSASVLSAQAARIVQGTGVNVRTTPQVSRPADAWSYLSGAWNRLREQLGDAGGGLPPLPSVQQPAPPQAATPPATATLAVAPAKPPAREPTKEAAVQPLAKEPPPAATSPGLGPTVPHAEPVVVPEFGNFPPRLPMQPMPKLPRDGPREQTLDELLTDYVGRLLKLNGMLAVCVFERKTATARAHGGRGYAPESMAAQGQALVQASLLFGRGLSMPLAGPETALTLAAHHVVLHPLPRHPELMLLAVLDKGAANLTLARLQIQRLDEDFSI